MNQYRLNYETTSTISALRTYQKKTLVQRIPFEDFTQMESSRLTLDCFRDALLCSKFCSRAVPSCCNTFQIHSPGQDRPASHRSPVGHCRNRRVYSQNTLDSPATKGSATVILGRAQSSEVHPLPLIVFYNSFFFPFFTSFYCQSFFYCCS